MAFVFLIIPGGNQNSNAYIFVFVKINGPMKFEKKTVLIKEFSIKWFQQNISYLSNIFRH